MPLGRTSDTWGKPHYKCQYCGEEYRSKMLWMEHEKKCIKKDDKKNNI